MIFTKKTYIIVAILLMVISLVPIWISKYFPSQNTPGYLLIVKMFKEYYNPDFDYANYYDLKLIIIPHLLFHIIVYLFSFIFPVIIAGKIVLSMVVILLPLSVFYFLNIVNPKKILLGFVSFLYIYNYSFLRGYNTFCLSISIFFFVFGYWLKNKEKLTIQNIILLNILTFLLYVCHLATFSLLVFSMVVYIFIQYKSIRKVFGLIILFIPSFIFLVQYVIENLLYSNWITFGDFLCRPFHWNIQYFFLKFFYSFSKIEILIVLIPILSIFYLVVKNIIRNWHECYFYNETKFISLIKFLFRKPMLSLTIILFLLYFILPERTFGWHKVNLRLLPFIFIFALAIADIFTKRIFNKAFFISIILMSICQYTLLAYNVIKINKDLNDYVSGISIIERNKLLLPIKIEDYKVGQIRPLERAFSYYNIVKGGATPRSVAEYNTLVPIVYKRYPIFEDFPYFFVDTEKLKDKYNLNTEIYNYIHFCGKDINIYSNMQKIQKIYDYVLFWGKDKSIFNLFEKYNFTLIHQQGKLWLYKNMNAKRNK